MSLKDKKTFRNLNHPSKEKFSSQNVVYLEKETTRTENLSKPLVKANSIKFEFNFINYTVKIINETQGLRICEFPINPKIIIKKLNGSSR